MLYFRIVNSFVGSTIFRLLLPNFAGETPWETLSRLGSVGIKTCEKKLNNRLNSISHCYDYNTIDISSIGVFALKHFPPL